jgi:oxygen-independent coproporphyrinogen-3 oxidase
MIDTSNTAQVLTTSEHLPTHTLALYLHIPFCRTRCSYCAFNTYAGLTDLMPSYLRALDREIRLVAATRRQAHTIYFGGGTPSLVPPDQIAALLRTCADSFILDAATEITLEANPGTVSHDYLSQIRQAGVNRLSLGMQSAQPDELRLFARRHSLDDVQISLDTARAAGFDNINLDLIYGIPRQTLSQWQHNLDTAIDLAPTHLSLYSLSIEDATPMQRWLEEGKMDRPDPDLAADMYEWATDRLAAAGYEQYEISNWAKPGFECRHNVHIWRNLPYLGLGAGAHGGAAATRYANVLLPNDYIARIESQPAPRPFPLSAAADEIDPLTLPDVMAETMMLGLRLIQEGVALDTFSAHFERELWDVYGTELDRLIREGLVTLDADRCVRLTRRGRLLGNYVFREFI